MNVTTSYPAFLSEIQHWICNFVPPVSSLQLKKNEVD
jgi:hypothetical protein